MHADEDRLRSGPQPVEQRLCTEALRGLIDVAFTYPTVYRVYATCDVDNVGPWRVMEKAGMQREGLLRRYIVHPNISHEPRDSFIYAVVR